MHAPRHVAWLAAAALAAVAPADAQETRPWRVPLPPSPLERAGAFPAIAGDRAVVSTALETLALDARSGELLWKSERDGRWAELDPDFALDAEQGLFGPVVAGEIVLAALQLPDARASRASHTSHLPPPKPPPERRLHAFDLASGRPLWHHAPPLPWDGRSGTLAQRARVVGPPVVVGSRVLVPCGGLTAARPGDRRADPVDDFFVACYELETGELAWSAFLATATPLERSMFGSRATELVTPRLVVAGKRAIAVTHCGVVAALSVRSGHVVWSTAYERTLPGPTRGWEPVPVVRHWRAAPPVVADGVVIATPNDGRDLLALDVATGELLFSHPPLEADTLLGADRATIWLGGDRALVALRKPNGLGSEGELEPAWSVELGESAAPMPRALLTEGAILVPRPDGIAAYDRASGEPLPERALPWPADPGDLALAGDVLVTQSSSTVAGLVLGEER